MNTTPDPTPDPVFVQNLEWQVRTAARRTSRFVRPPARGPIRFAKLAVIVAVALAGGASGTLAFQHVQQSRAATILGHRAQLELALAEQRVAALEARADVLRRQEQAAVVSASEVANAIAALDHGRSEMQLRQLDLQETTASGRAPDDSLFAPLAGGRDFVTARLDVRRNDAAGAVVRAEQSLQRVQQLANSGFASVTELDAMRAEVEKRKAVVTTFAARLELRRRFLAGNLSAARVELEERRVVATMRADELAATINAAEASLKRSQALQERGFVPQGEVDAATLALTEAKAASELTHDELALIDEELAATK